MSWIRPIVRGLAMTVLPVTLLDKGIDHAKSELRNEIASYEVKLKAMVLLGTVFLLMLTFLSIAIALILGHWLGSDFAGFAIVSGVYLTVFFLLLVAYKDKLQENR